MVQQETEGQLGIEAESRESEAKLRESEAKLGRLEEPAALVGESAFPHQDRGEPERSPIHPLSEACISKR